MIRPQEEFLTGDLGWSFGCDGCVKCLIYLFSPLAFIWKIFIETFYLPSSFLAFWKTLMNENKLEANGLPGDYTGRRRGAFFRQSQFMVIRQDCTVRMLQEVNIVEDQRQLFWESDFFNWNWKERWELEGIQELGWGRVSEREAVKNREVAFSRWRGQ